MDIINNMNARRKELGLSVGFQTMGQSIKEQKKPVPIVGNKTERKSLREMRAEIIENKPKAKAVKKYIKESIERLTAESSDDEGI